MAMNDDVLPCGTRVHKGNLLMYSAYAQGRMEQIWGSDVMEFKPERWLKDGVFQPESPYKYPVFHVSANKFSPTYNVDDSHMMKIINFGLTHGLQYADALIPP